MTPWDGGVRRSVGSLAESRQLGAGARASRPDAMPVLWRGAAAGIRTGWTGRRYGPTSRGLAAMSGPKNALGS